MRRLFATLQLAVALLLASHAFPQGGNTITIPSNGAPTGTCAFLQLSNDTTNGVLYFCDNTGHWKQLLAGGGGGTASYTGTVGTLPVGVTNTHTLGDTNPAITQAGGFTLFGPLTGSPANIGIGTATPTHTLHIVTNTNNAVGIDSTGTDSNSMFHIKNVSAQGPFFDFWSAADRWAFGASSDGHFLFRQSAVGTDPVNGTTLLHISTAGALDTVGGYNLCTGTSDTSTAMACATPGALAPIAGATITLVPDVDSGASPTLAVNGGAAGAIYRQGGQTAVGAGEIKAGKPELLTLDAAGNWDLSGSMNVIPPTVTPTFGANQVIAGCGVDYVSGLTFTVGACTYVIAGIQYASAAASVTLDNGYASGNDRIDVIAVNTSQAVVVLKGPDVAGPPAAPTADPTTEFALTFVYVAGNATTPSNISTTVLYDEGAGGEYTASRSPATDPPWNLASTNGSPYSGTKDIEATNTAATNYVQFLVPSSGTVDLSTKNTLLLYVKPKSTWASGRTLTFSWYLTGVIKSTTQVVLRDGTFGFSRTNTTAWQQVSIPLSTFGVGVAVNQLRIIASGTMGFYLDRITLQAGTNPPVLPTTLMNFRGTWNATAAYQPNDTVVSGGLGYVALAANTNVAVTTAATWAPLANVPAATDSTLGLVKSGTCTNQFLRSITTGTGAFNCASITTSDLTGDALIRNAEASEGDGTNAIAAATLNAWGGFSDFTGTLTVTGVTCKTDSGTSTCDVQACHNVASAESCASMLSGVITGTTIWAAGSLSGTPTIPAGYWLKYIFVCDGTTKFIAAHVNAHL